MNDKNRPAPRAATPTTASPLVPIRVRQLRFCVQGGRDVPLTGSNGGKHTIEAKAKGDGRVEIQYEPWQRHHRVTEFVGDKVRIQFCVPESWCLYVPEEITATQPPPEPTAPEQTE